MTGQDGRSRGERGSEKNKNGDVDGGRSSGCVVLVRMLVEVIDADIIAEAAVKVTRLTY